MRRPRSLWCRRNAECARYGVAGLSVFKILSTLGGKSSVPGPAPPGSLRPRPAGLRPTAPPCRQPVLRDPAPLAPCPPELSGQTEPGPGGNPRRCCPGGPECPRGGPPTGPRAGRCTSTRRGTRGPRPPWGRSGHPRVTDGNSPRDTNPSNFPRRSHACHKARTHSAVWPTGWVRSELPLNHPHSPRSSPSSPNETHVGVGAFARQAYSHSASVGNR